MVLRGLGCVAWTHLSEFANLFRCVVKGFLALGSVRSGGLDAWDHHNIFDTLRVLQKYVKS